MQVTGVVVLGMHRSGTSCLAGMLAAGGVASAGHAVRNWDNARGHHEMLDVVRLDEAVLAHSGGHWLSPPREVRWTDDHEATRDRILRARIGGRPALLKDPRMLLVLPFWRASAVPFHVIGIVRHPLAVARSLESWRETPLPEGIALWTAHARVLADDHARHRYPLVDFEQPRASTVAAVEAACTSLGLAFDAVALAAAYEEQLVHHDDADAPSIAGLPEAVELYRALAARATAGTRPRSASTRGQRAYPRRDLARFTQLVREGEVGPALDHARAAIASISDAAAVVVPVITALVRHRRFAEARALIAEHASRLSDGLADLLHGKVLLAQGDAVAAVAYLEVACLVAHPFFQARHLLPQALRAAGRHDDARAAMQHVIAEALYPHGPLATIAEWSWLDGERAAAIASMERAIAAAPAHRRGRLRTRRAEWLIAHGDTDAARSELMRAVDEDPGYPRSREVLARLV